MTAQTVKAEHTPGPWTDNTADRGPHGEILHKIVGGDRFQTLADISQLGYGQIDEMRANARLIAAAPTMYEALRGLLAFIEALHEPGFTVDFHYPQHIADFDAARAAIRLVEGEK